MGTLFQIRYSPWSIKARWALLHHRVRFEAVDYVPMVTTPKLRLALRQPVGRVSVPVYIDEAGAFCDSWDIARRAEVQSSAEPLIPADLQPSVERWNELSNTLMSAGRALFVSNVRHNQIALEAQLPAFVPRVMRPQLTGVARFGVEFVTRKYRIETDDTAQRQVARGVLGRLRQALEVARGEYLLGDRFTYADVAMAVALGTLAFDARAAAPVDPAVASAWYDGPLVEESTDVLAWRDRIVTTHFPGGAA